MVNNEQIVAFYEQMLRIATWEQKLLRFIDEGKTSGFYHPGRGQEAVAVGACAALRPDDYIMYDHRGCGHLIAKGLPLVKLFGDFLGTVAGATRGLGAGIVHVAWPELGILGQSGTLGGCFPIAAGAALSAKYRGTDQVVLCFFGEGTGNRGTFHEAANAAALWKLPVIWLCENNQYAISTHVSASTSVENVADRAAAYGMPWRVVDGMDSVAVYAATAEAVSRARGGAGPSLIEAKTYRFRGHFVGDPEPYRAPEEVAAWKRRDPITTLGARLLAEGIATEQALEAIRLSVQREVDEAAATAAQAALPPRERLYQGVYA